MLHILKVKTFFMQFSTTVKCCGETHPKGVDLNPKIFISQHLFFSM